MRNPIFIVGLPRTGSTVWHNMITMNSDILRLTEMHFLHPFNKDFRYFMKRYVGDLKEEKNIRQMIEMMLSRRLLKGIDGAFWRFQKINGIDDPKLKENLYSKIVGSDKSLGSLFKIIHQEITDFNEYDRCCTKFPVYVNHIPDLMRWYPNCKIMHITRDPRAIAISKTNDPSGTGIFIKKHPSLKFVIRNIMILFVVMQYTWTSMLHSKYKHFSNYKLFKFEDLLAEPAKVIKELCKFLEIEYKDIYLNLRKGEHEHQPSSITGKRQKKFDKRAAYRWRTVITPFERFLVTKLAKRSMERFDFNPEHHPIYRE